MSPLLLLLALGGPAHAAGGAIEVDSDPPGGAIWIDGRDTGLRTPATVSDLAPGVHQVLVRGDCVAGRQQVEVLTAGTALVDMPLLAQGGMLRLDLSPTDAQVELDGSRLPVVGGLPMAVDCGIHSLKVSAPGHQTLVMEVQVQAASTTEHRVVLDEVGLARLQVEVAPGGASIWLDDQRQGEGAQRLEVVAGPHVLRATLAGYADQERQLVVEAGQVLPVAFSLLPLPASADPGSSRKRRPWIGVGIAGVGAAGVAWGTFEYLQGRQGWADFNDRRTKVESGLWPDEYDDDPAAWAYDMYDAEVKPHRTRMLVGDIVGGVLLSSGLVLAFTL